MINLYAHALNDVALSIEPKELLHALYIVFSLQKQHLQFSLDANNGCNRLERVD